MLTSRQRNLLLLRASFQGLMRPLSLSLTPTGSYTQLFMLPPRTGHVLEHAAKFQVLSFSLSWDPGMGPRKEELKSPKQKEMEHGSAPQGEAAIQHTPWPQSQSCLPAALPELRWSSIEPWLKDTPTHRPPYSCLDSGYNFSHPSLHKWV